MPDNPPTVHRPVPTPARGSIGVVQYHVTQSTASSSIAARGPTIYRPKTAKPSTSGHHREHADDDEERTRVAAMKRFASDDMMLSASQAQAQAMQGGNDVEGLQQLYKRKRARHEDGGRKETGYDLQSEGGREAEMGREGSVREGGQVKKSKMGKEGQKEGAHKAKEKKDRHQVSGSSSGMGSRSRPSTPTSNTSPPAPVIHQPQPARPVMLVSLPTDAEATAPIGSPSMQCVPRPAVTEHWGQKLNLPPPPATRGYLDHTPASTQKAQSVHVQAQEGAVEPRGASTPWGSRHEQDPAMQHDRRPVQLDARPEQQQCQRTPRRQREISPDTEDEGGDSLDGAAQQARQVSGDPHPIEQSERMAPEHRRSAPPGAATDGMLHSVGDETVEQEQHANQHQLEIQGIPAIGAQNDGTQQAARSEMRTTDPSSPLAIFPRTLLDKIAKYRAFHNLPLSGTATRADKAEIKNDKQGFIRLELNYLPPVYEDVPAQHLSFQQEAQYEDQLQSAADDSHQQGDGSPVRRQEGAELEGLQHHQQEQEDHGMLPPSSAHANTFESQYQYRYEQDTQAEAQYDQVLVDATLIPNDADVSPASSPSATEDDGINPFDMSQSVTSHEHSRSFVPNTYPGTYQDHHNPGEMYEPREGFKQEHLPADVHTVLELMRELQLPARYELTVHTQRARANLEVDYQSWALTFEEPVRAYFVFAFFPQVPQLTGRTTTTMKPCRTPLAGFPRLFSTLKNAAISSITGLRYVAGHR